MTSPTRIQLSRAKGWRKPAESVRCDRATILGNPWAAGTPGQLHLLTRAVPGKRSVWLPCPPMPDAMTAQDVVTAHAAWLRDGTIAMPPDLSASGENLIRDSLTELRSAVLDMLARLRGRDFCCWCKPGEPCHADTLLRIANE